MKGKDIFPVLVIGGGVAGIGAALAMADAGRRVHLVEKGFTLGGQVAKLDKLYPTDHCAFCPLWTDIKRLREHPLITTHCHAEVKELDKAKTGFHAVVVRKAAFIDESRCVFCGKCLKECQENAIVSQGAHVYPPSYRVDTEICTRCGRCVPVCPTGAIDFQRTDETFDLTCEHVVWAAGFTEFDLTPHPEFGVGSHPDIMTSLEFEEWTAEGGINKGKMVRKSNRSLPRAIAFIQCAGARDQRLLPYCSAVCCMHALKQARWVKRRNPSVHCVIFYTDLRTVGRDYYEYSLRDLGVNGVRLIRGRPSLIYPLPGGEGIAVRFENTMTQKREIWKFDMVVLNGNLSPSPVGAEREKGDLPSLTAEGFVNGEGDDISRLACGFTREPADVAESVIQASAMAMKTLSANREW